MYNYSYLTTSADISDAGYAALGGALGGVFAGMIMAIYLISIAIGVLTIIANWKIFTKAGQAGWKSLIPIYNIVILFRIAGVSPWWILGYFAAWVPFVGWILSVGVSIYVMVKLAKAFGKGDGFAVGLILLNTIFIMILGFGSSSYQLNRKPKMNVEIEE